MKFSYGDTVLILNRPGKQLASVIKQCGKDPNSLWVEIVEGEPLRVKVKNVKKVKVEKTA